MLPRGSLLPDSAKRIRSTSVSKTVFVEGCRMPAVAAITASHAAARVGRRRTTDAFLPPLLRSERCYRGYPRVVFVEGLEACVDARRNCFNGFIQIHWPLFASEKTHHA
jgi:hypothetical protein